MRYRHKPSQKWLDKREALNQSKKKIEDRVKLRQSLVDVGKTLFIDGIRFKKQKQIKLAKKVETIALDL